MALQNSNTTTDAGRVGKTKESHTAGPWSSVYGGEYVVPQAHENRPMGAAADALVDRTEYAMQICRVNDDHRHGRLNKEANASLIAAAPDLLAACEATFVTVQAIVDAHEAEPFRTELDPAARFQNDLRNSAGLLRAAIARARGSAVQR